MNTTPITGPRSRLGRRGFLARAAALGAVVPVSAAVLAGCYDAPDTPTPTAGPSTPAGTASGTPAGTPSATAAPSTTATATDGTTFSLRTSASHSGLAFVGVGGAVDGVENPTLAVAPGDTVQIRLEDGDGAEHDISFPDFGVTAPRVVGVGNATTVTFTASKEGSFAYFCTLPGHRQAGMQGTIQVGSATQSQATAPSIVREPTDLPPPLPARDPKNVRVDMEAVELEGQLAEGATYTYWTFGGKVPGPFLRVRVDDTVELHLTNGANSKATHSIDLHAATGPGGGAAVMQVAPNEEKAFTFKALNPGLYVYHCATPSVAHHISNGMFGLILVEPEGGLPEVDREFYVMQSDMYTVAPFGTKGPQEFSAEKLLAEAPEYFVLNGAVGALSDQHTLKARVGETARVYFGVGGPNATSSFHIIGEIFDRVYNQGSLTSAPLTDVQTTTVAPGGATVVELALEIPGRYLLVDHALTRLEKGLLGFLEVEGADNPEIFREGAAE